MVTGLSFGNRVVGLVFATHLFKQSPPGGQVGNLMCRDEGPEPVRTCLLPGDLQLVIKIPPVSDTEGKALPGRGNAERCHDLARWKVPGRAWKTSFQAVGPAPVANLAQSPGRLLGTEDPRVVVRLER